MKYLCETCEPDWAEMEIFGIVPLMPCDQCGVFDDRFKGGPRVHAMPSGESWYQWPRVDQSVFH